MFNQLNFVVGAQQRQLHSLTRKAFAEAREKALMSRTAWVPDDSNAESTIDHGDGIVLTIFATF